MSHPVTYTAVLPTSDETVLFVSGLLAAERRRRGTRRGRRALGCYRQAVLILRWFCDGTRLAQLAADYGLSLDPDAVVGDLPVGLQQRVEIAKALVRDAQTLVLDEPTAVLTPEEADGLFRLLRILAREGKTVILITHKLREIMAVTDRVSVMRRCAMVQAARPR